MKYVISKKSKKSRLLTVLQKEILFDKSASGGNKTRQVSQQGSWASWIDVQTLTDNIFDAVTCRTNIQNKKDGMCH
jgi:hypothetical protein